MTFLAGQGTAVLGPAGFCWVRRVVARPGLVPVTAVSPGVFPGLSATPGWLLAGLGRAVHRLGAAWLGWARHLVARPGAVPVTAVGRERVSRPSAASAQHTAWNGCARFGKARQAPAGQGQACRGGAWHGPVTAVACGLVPQASAAPGHLMAMLSRARQDRAVQRGERRGGARLGKGRADGRSAGSTPAPPASLGAGRSGETRRGRAVPGLAWHGRHWRGEVWHGVERHTSEFESLTATVHGSEWRGRARLGCGPDGQAAAARGMAWDSRTASSHTGCEALASTHSWLGQAGAWLRLSMARLGMVRQGPVRRCKAGTPNTTTPYGVTHV